MKLIRTERQSVGLALLCLAFSWCAPAVSNAASFRALGDKKILGVQVKFASGPNNAPSLEEISTAVNNAKFYYSRWSFNKLNLLPEVVTITLPKARSEYASIGTMNGAAERLLRQSGVPIDTFRSVGYYPGGSFGCKAGVGGSEFTSGGTNTGCTLHEMGHNFGFDHQRIWKQTGASLDTGTAIKKSDPFHFMSGGSDLAPSGADPEPYEKFDRGWMTRGARINEDGSHSHRIYNFDQRDIDPENTVRTSSIKRLSGKDDQIWLGYRSRDYRDNAQMRQGLQLYYRKDYSTKNTSLIDVMPFSGIGSNGLFNHTLQPGRTFEDEDGSVYITNLGKGGEAPNEYIDVRINRGDYSDNAAPVPTWDAPDVWFTNNELTISAAGNDPDGDETASSWSLNGDVKPFNTSAMDLSLTWDVIGTQDIAVLVTDMKGQTAELTKTINILPAMPGDYNLDGYVDAADFTTWRLALGGTESLPNDDTAGVGQDDYTRWSDNFGRSSFEEMALLSAVPEPTSGLLSALGLFILFAVRRGARKCP